MIPAIVLSVIFLGLGLIHFNWAAGGRWGFDAALPTTKDGKRILNPRWVDSAIVGIGLFGFSLFYLYNTDLLDWSLPAWVTKYGRWIVPLIFFGRAIGDFNYVGLFKKVRDTEFAKMDDRLFSPLCLIVALLGMSVIWLH